MNCEKAPTGKPSEDRRWMQYYPEMMLKMIQKPECTLKKQAGLTVHHRIWDNTSTVLNGRVVMKM